MDNKVDIFPNEEKELNNENEAQKKIMEIIFGIIIIKFYLLEKI